MNELLEQLLIALAAIILCMALLAVMAIIGDAILRLADFLGVMRYESELWTG